MKKLITCLLSVFGFLSFNAQCDYTVEMQDSWGDGWNGNTIDVLVNGEVVLDDVTLASGSSEDVAINVNRIWTSKGGEPF